MVKGTEEEWQELLRVCQDALLIINEVDQLFSLKIEVSDCTITSEDVKNRLIEALARMTGEQHGQPDLSM